MTAFNKFRVAYNLPNNWPSPVSHLSLFITYCFEMGYAPSTISTYLAGLGYYHKLRSLEDPTASFVIKKLLEGCRRMRQNHNVRAPITESILQKISSVLHHVCYSPYEASLFRAAYFLAYFGLLQVSEIVFTSSAQANRPLLFVDVLLTERPRALILSIRFSKNNQTGPPTSLRIPESGNPSLCPFVALKHYLTLRVPAPNYLFVYQNSSPLTRSQFSAV